MAVEPPAADRSAPARGLLPAVLSGLLGVAAIGFLALTRRTDPMAYLAAVIVAAVAVPWLVWFFARRPAAPEPAAGAIEPSPEAPSFEAAMEALAEPILLVRTQSADDVAGSRVVFANAAAREFLRIPREGALLVAALRDPVVLEIVDEALFGRIEGVAAFETRGAQDRIWRVWTRPLECPKVRERYAVVSMRDETDARRMEQMRADFLANASHELRTPLASLAGFIETLKGHAKDDPKARDRFLDIMTAQAERMRRLIVDLLSLSRIELNEHIPPSGEADLSQIALDVIDGLSPIAGRKGVKLAPNLPAMGAARLCGDRDQIVQVVQNLVDNAIKYSPGGEAVDITVDAGLTTDQAATAADPRAARLSLLTPDRTEQARYVRIRVRDHGPGVARQHLPRLTERFYRVEGQKSGEHLGTGLGLAIVKHITNRHRGGMMVESVPGEGAAFTVYFPSEAVDVRAGGRGRVRFQPVAESEPQTAVPATPKAAPLQEAGERNKTVTETS
jgi:two-component system phosphate regulon sensor histidine kinase PhoR